MQQTATHKIHGIKMDDKRNPHPRRRNFSVCREESAEGQFAWEVGSSSGCRVIATRINEATAMHEDARNRRMIQEFVEEICRGILSKTLHGGVGLQGWVLQEGGICMGVSFAGG